MEEAGVEFLCICDQYSTPGGSGHPGLEACFSGSWSTVENEVVVTVFAHKSVQEADEDVEGGMGISMLHAVTGTRLSPTVHRHGWKLLHQGALADGQVEHLQIAGRLDVGCRDHAEIAELTNLLAESRSFLDGCVKL